MRENFQRIENLLSMDRRDVSSSHRIERQVQLDFDRVGEERVIRIQSLIALRTPIINSLADVYGYFRFLGLRPWHDWTEFNNHIGRLEKKNRESHYRRTLSSSSVMVFSILGYDSPTSHLLCLLDASNERLDARWKASH